MAKIANEQIYPGFEPIEEETPARIPDDQIYEGFEPADVEPVTPRYSGATTTRSQAQPEYTIESLTPSLSDVRRAASAAGEEFTVPIMDPLGGFEVAGSTLRTLGRFFAELYGSEETKREQTEGEIRLQRLKEDPEAAKGVLDAIKAAPGIVWDRWKLQFLGAETESAASRLADPDAEAPEDVIKRLSSLNVPDTIPGRKEQVTETLDRTLNEGYESIKETVKALQEKQSGFEQGSVPYYLLGIATNAGNMAPGIVATLFARNPAAMMGVMSWQVYFETLATSRLDYPEMPDEQRRAMAMVYAATEGLSEGIPGAGLVMKLGGRNILSVAGRVAIVGGAEAMQEVFNEAAQIIYEVRVLGEEYSVPEIMQRLKDAGVIGWGAGTVMGGAGAIADPTERVSRGTPDQPGGVPQPTVVAPPETPGGGAGVAQPPGAGTAPVQQRQGALESLIAQTAYQPDFQNVGPGGDVLDTYVEGRRAPSMAGSVRQGDALDQIVRQGVDVRERAEEGRQGLAPERVEASQAAAQQAQRETGTVSPPQTADELVTTLRGQEGEPAQPPTLAEQAVQELNELNPQLGGTLRVETLSPEEMAKRKTEGGYVSQAGTYGAVINVTEDMDPVGVAEEVRHMIDMLLGGRMLTLNIEESTGWREKVRAFLKGRQDAGDATPGANNFNASEMAQQVLDHYFRNPDVVKQELPEVFELLESLEAEKYRPVMQRVYDAMSQETGPQTADELATALRGQEREPEQPPQPPQSPQATAETVTRRLGEAQGELAQRQAQRIRERYGDEAADDYLEQWRQRAEATDEPMMARRRAVEEQVEAEERIARQAAGTPNFRRWSKGQAVTDEANRPVIVYRGQYGTGEQQTREPTITLTDAPGVADYYAQSPNLAGDAGEASRRNAYFVRMKKPLDLSGTGEDVIEVGELRRALVGEGVTRNEFDSLIERFQWRENGEVTDTPGDEAYVEAYKVFSDPEVTKAAKRAGYDGFIYNGSAPFVDDLTNLGLSDRRVDLPLQTSKEYRVFNRSQLLPVEDAPLSERYTGRADVEGLERVQAGVSVETDGPPAELRVREGSADLYRALTDENTVDVRVPRTVGMYGGGIEQSFDFEAISTQPDMNRLEAEVARWGQKYDQTDVFVSRVLKPNESNENARPGIEIHLRDSASLEDVQGIIDRITERQDPVTKGNEIDGFTFMVDPRFSEGIVGVRFQYVPEFDARYSDEWRRRFRENPRFLNETIERKRAILAEIAAELSTRDDVASARMYWYDTRVVGSERYGEYQGEAQADAGGGRGQARGGQSVRARVARAIESYGTERESDGGQRETPAEGVEAEPLTRRGSGAFGLPIDEVEAEARRVAGGLGITETPRVVLDVESLPGAVHEFYAARNRGAAIPTDTKGVFVPGDGVYIVANNVEDRTDVQRTIVHEYVGHVGVLEFLGDSAKPVFEQIYRDNSKAVQKVAARLKLDLGNERQRLTAIQEYVAEFAEKAPSLLPQWLTNLVVAIRNKLRQMGLVKKLWSRAEILELIQRSRQQVRATGGQSTSAQGRLITARSRVMSEMRDIESRIIYDKTNQTPQSLALDRERYNYLRSVIGWPRVTNWTERPAPLASNRSPVPDVMFSSIQTPSGPVFVSAVEQAVERQFQNSDRVSGHLGKLKSLMQKGEITKDEIEWLGLQDWLESLRTPETTEDGTFQLFPDPDPVVSKQDIINYIRANELIVFDAFTEPSGFNSEDGLPLEWEPDFNRTGVDDDYVEQRYEELLEEYVDQRFDEITRYNEDWQDYEEHVREFDEDGEPSLWNMNALRAELEEDTSITRRAQQEAEEEAPEIYEWTDPHGDTWSITESHGEAFLSRDGRVLGNYGDFSHAVDAVHEQMYEDWYNSGDQHEYEYEEYTVLHEENRGDQGYGEYVLRAKLDNPDEQGYITSHFKYNPASGNMVGTTKSESREGDRLQQLRDVIGWARYTEQSASYTDENGKLQRGRFLFIEEIQSDWHQRSRKEKKGKLTEIQRAQEFLRENAAIRDYFGGLNEVYWMLISGNAQFDVNPHFVPTTQENDIGGLPSEENYQNLVRIKDELNEAVINMPYADNQASTYNIIFDPHVPFLAPEENEKQTAYYFDQYFTEWRRLHRAMRSRGKGVEVEPNTARVMDAVNTHMRNNNSPIVIKTSFTHQLSKLSAAIEMMSESAQETIGEITSNEQALKIWAEKYRHAKSLEDAIAIPPLKNTWPLTIWKRLIRYAADHGYDGVAWTPGIMQAERWGGTSEEDIGSLSADQLGLSKFYDIGLESQVRKYVNRLGGKIQGASPSHFGDISYDNPAGELDYGDQPGEAAVVTVNLVDDLVATINKKVVQTDLFTERGLPFHSETLLKAVTVAIERNPDLNQQLRDNAANKLKIEGATEYDLFSVWRHRVTVGAILHEWLAQGAPKKVVPRDDMYQVMVAMRDKEGKPDVTSPVHVYRLMNASDAKVQEAYARYVASGGEIPAVILTDTIKNKVMEPQPLFSIRGKDEHGPFTGRVDRREIEKRTRKYLGMTPEEFDNLSVYQRETVVRGYMERFYEPRIDTTSARFARWFGKSVVTNPRGKPREVAHGTSARSDFSAFRKGDIGFHFGTNLAAEMRGLDSEDAVMEVAEYFDRKDNPARYQGRPDLGVARPDRYWLQRALGHRLAEHEGLRLIHAYLRIENPLYLSDVGVWDDPQSWDREQREVWAAVDPDTGNWFQFPTEVPKKLLRAQLNNDQYNAVIAHIRNGLDDLYDRNVPYDKLRKEWSQELVRMLKQFGYDGITYRNAVEDPGSPSWIVFDANQIKSSRGNIGLIDLNNGWSLNHDDIHLRRSRSGNRRRGPLDRWQAAMEPKFQWISHHIARVLSKVGLAQNLPPEFKRALRRYRAEVFSAKRAATEIGEIGLTTLSPEQREILSDYIEKELAVGDIPPHEIQSIAAQMQTALETQSRELHDLGMLDQETIERWAGKYLPRYYTKHEGANSHAAVLRKWWGGISGKHLRGRGQFEFAQVRHIHEWMNHGWEIRHEEDKQAYVDGELEDVDKILMWRDYTKDEREKMGEIRDAVYRFVRGYMETSRDIAMGRLFRAIANSEYSSDHQVDENWRQVPDTIVKGTGREVWDPKQRKKVTKGGIKRYGMLAGMWVPSEVMTELGRMVENKGLLTSDESPIAPLENVYMKALSLWKEGKTAMNPVVHSNNIWSSWIMLDLYGISVLNVKKYKDGLKGYTSKDQFYQEGVRNGLFGTEFYSQELRQIFEPQLQEEFDSIEDAAAGRLGRWLDITAKYTGARKYREKMGRLYEAEDQFFKYMIYRDMREKGHSIDEAIDEAERWIFNYADLPVTARFIKNSPLGLPFLSYTYKASQAIAYAYITRPWAVGKWTALFAGANWVIYNALFGDDDEFQEERERTAMPAFMRGTTPFLTHKALRWPFGQREGFATFLDLSRRWPMGDMFDMENQMGGLPLPAPLVPNNPVFTSMMAFIANKDSFTGRDIINPETDDWMMAAQKRMGWAAYQALPNTPLLPFSYSFDKVMNGLSHATGYEIKAIPGIKEYAGKNYYGEEQQLDRALASTLLGFKIRSYDIDRKLADRKRQYANVLDDLRYAGIQVGRDQSLTEAQKERQLRKIRERMQEIIEEYNETFGDLEELEDQYLERRRGDARR